jgi:DNA (cytosine-5)-methyltransferase 1
MTAYYNEIDPAVAQWLRNLIEAGHIAPGYVDERSIEDVYPSDLRGFTQCHFFAGIGVWSHALRSAGWSDDRPVWTGSCPCQPFSSAGKGAGFDDERHLWPAFQHLIKECKPATVIGEQVASKDADAWIDLVHTDLEALGYAFGAVPFPSAGVGAPHIRDRLYWVGHASGTGLAQRERITGVPGGTPAGNTGQAFERAGIYLGGMANHHGDGCQQGGERGEAMGYGQAVGTDRGAGGVEYARQNDDASQIKTSCAGESQAIRSANQFGGSSVSLGTGTGPTNGYWRTADWLLCRDGKFRPVEPGTFPLAHGAAARVVRLRAYGNAINAKAAQAFIECVMRAA